MSLERFKEEIVNLSTAELQKKLATVSGEIEIETILLQKDIKVNWLKDTKRYKDLKNEKKKNEAEKKEWNSINALIKKPILIAFENNGIEGYLNKYDSKKYTDMFLHISTIKESKKEKLIPLLVQKNIIKDVLDERFIKKGLAGKVKHVLARRLANSKRKKSKRGRPEDTNEGRGDQQKGVIAEELQNLTLAPTPPEKKLTKEKSAIHNVNGIDVSLDMFMRPEKRKSLRDFNKNPSLPEQPKDNKRAGVRLSPKSY